MRRVVPRPWSHFCFPFVEVLTWVDGGVLEHLEEGEKAACQKASKQRTNPVNPVISREIAVDHVGAEGSGRVE